MRRLKNGEKVKNIGTMKNVNTAYVPYEYFANKIEVSVEAKLEATRRIL